MSVKIKLKAFLGFSLTLISLNAFSVLKTQYLESVFKSNANVNLIAEDIQVLDAKKYIKSNFDKLSLQIYLSEIFRQEKAYLFSFNNRINFYTQLSNGVALAHVYQALGIANALKNNFEKADTLFSKALTEYQLLNNMEGVGVSSQNLSWLNYIGSNLKQSLSYNKIAIASINKANKPLFGYLVWQNNILLAQGKAAQVEQEILNRGLIMASRNNKKLQEWECYYQLGKSYLLQNKLVQARWFFVQALTLSTGFRSNVYKLKTLLMLARAKRKSKDYSLALQDLRLAQSLAVNQYHIFEIDIAKQLAEIYKSLGNPVRERQYLLAYNKLKDSYVK